jgi:phosphate transport system permease protein
MEWPTADMTAPRRPAIAVERRLVRLPIFQFASASAPPPCWSGVLGGVVVSLFDRRPGRPSHKFGFGFLTSTTWNPVTEVYGAAGPIAGTVITAAAWP